MRIALINEGTYPVLNGGVSTWCDQLINNLYEHDFHLVTITGKDTTPVWDLPKNVTGMSLMGMWDPSPGRSSLAAGTTRLQLRSARQVLDRMWSAVLPAGQDEADLPALRSALWDWSLLGPQPLAWVMAREGSTSGLMQAWSDHRGVAPNLSELSAASAAHITRFVDRSLAIMDLRFPEVDLVHAAANGPAALLGLARHWQDGTPLLLTEHGVYLRERYLALNATGWPWNVRYGILAFLRAVCRLAYADAARISPVSEFNASWESELGAPPGKIIPIANGVDPSRLPHLTDEPNEPTVSFVGRIDPLKDLETMIAAFALVHQHLPTAKLRLFGPVPAGNESYHHKLLDQITALGLAPHVSFEGSVSNPLTAIRAGHVVALSSISEGLPFTVIEAMMAGRATVNTDVGGVRECVGVDGVRGMLVGPRDPEAFADAVLQLLTDSTRRMLMGHAAREYAMANFTLGRFVERYRDILDECKCPPSPFPRRAFLAESQMVMA